MLKKKFLISHAQKSTGSGSPEARKGAGILPPPTPWPVPASIKMEVIIQAAPTTTARIVWAGIRVMPGLTTITAAQVGAAG